jgi:hypothetical protein
MQARLTQNNYWDTDLSVIEATFVKKGSKITDLSVYLNNTVPEQGSVLLDKVINTDNILKNPTFLQKLQFFLKNNFSIPQL